MTLLSKTWHFVAFTFDDIKDEAAVYVDDLYGYTIGSDESLVKKNKIG